MLQMKDVVKEYVSGNIRSLALDHVDLRFRDSEFVAVLGPSGAGKTTLLNLIGGLDHCDSGEVYIDGCSTADYKSKDWDYYRNHRIGFVFQSYNLIPHQTVLRNVELAMTIAGVSRKERKLRAQAVLEQVGLQDQMHKLPSELSGGQKQRVAIARALVNDPDVLLADEPTGSLDSQCSRQIVSCLQEIAKDRLVIMVTHDTELVKDTATRIIQLRDGKVVEDSHPYEAALPQIAKPAVTGKVKMRFLTSLHLSFHNLRSKKGRTLFAMLAGAIGIIGIALIAAVSNGMTTYIDAVQEETLSSYPLKLEATHMDMGSLMETFMGTAMSAGDHDKDAVYQKTILYNLVNSLNNMQSSENDLKTFKNFLEETMADTAEENALRDAINGIQYGYDLNLLIYTKTVDGNITLSDTEQLLMDLLVKHLKVDMSGMKEMGESYGFGDMMTMGGSTKLWQEMLPGNNGELINPLVYEQYELIDGGRWPSAYNEIVLVVDKNNELDDMTLYAMGLIPEEEMNALAEASMNQHEIEIPESRWTYEEIRNMEFRTVLPFNCYSYDEKTGLYQDMRVNEDGEENKLGMQYLYDNGLPLKVTGIIRLKEDAMAGMLTGKICYTSALTSHVIEQAKDAPVVKAQLENPDIDVFTGLPFKPETNTMTEQAFAEYLDTLDTATKAQMWKAYRLDMPEDDLKAAVDPLMKDVTPEQMKATLTAAYGAAGPDIQAYLSALDEESLKASYRSMLEQQESGKYAATKTAEYAAKTDKAVVKELNNALSKLDDSQRMTLYKTAEFIGYVNKLDESGLANAYVDILVADQQTQNIQRVETMSRENLLAMITQMTADQPSGSVDIQGYVESLSDEDLRALCVDAIRNDTMQTGDQTRKTIEAMLSQQGLATDTAKAAALRMQMQAFSGVKYVDYYDNVLDFSETTYEDNLVTLGNLELDSPATILLYASSFENKDVIEEAILNYNEGKDELQQIVYTDYVGLLMSSVTTIINAITYVLIAFVAISLIVSSIMIGVITLISVQERTKEIGILRAIGASKRNVSSMFNAETVIIGFTSGALGVGITYLLCIPINIILHHLTDIQNLSAALPTEAALILVGISVLLTLFAGIIPSRSAAKKDPVVALRTE